MKPVKQKPPCWRSGGYRLATAAPTTRPSSVEKKPDCLVHLPDIPVAIETRPIIKREFMEMGPESALIWDLGRAFHMKPSSSMHCYKWILLEKSLTRLFCATNQ